MNPSEILRSSCRQNILKALSKKKKRNIMSLVRDVNSTYNEVDRNLHILAAERLVVQTYVGKNRILRLNLRNEKTGVILKILALLDESIELSQLQRKLNLMEARS